jgi:hypothetical protein
MVHSLESGETKELFPGFAVGYLPTGHIVYGLPNDSSLYAIPFNLGTLEPKGGPLPIVEGVMGHGVQCAISDAGTLVYMPGTSSGGGFGQFQIYVRPYPEVDGGRWQVSSSEGVWPLWSPDGRELFYRSGDRYMAVPVKTELTFSFETPKVLFQGTYVIPSTTSFLSNWDIHPDGNRFLMIKPPTAAGSESTSAEPCKINIVLNWFQELKEKVPTD